MRYRFSGFVYVFCMIVQKCFFPSFIMACLNFVEICELLIVSESFAGMMDRGSAMALHITCTNSCRMFCELPSLRICYMLEWVAGKLQKVHVEYANILIKYGVRDDDLSTGPDVLFDAYQRIRRHSICNDLSFCRHVDAGLALARCRAKRQRMR